MSQTQDNQSLTAKYNNAIDNVTADLIATHSFNRASGAIDERLRGYINYIGELFKNQVANMQDRAQTNQRTIVLPKHYAMISFAHWAEAGVSVAPAYLLKDNSLSEQLTTYAQIVVEYANNNYMDARDHGDEEKRKEWEVYSQFATGLQKSLGLTQGPLQKTKLDAIIFPSDKVMRPS